MSDAPMYYGTYQLPSGEWQALAAFEAQEEAEAVMAFHAAGRPWRVDTAPPCMRCRAPAVHVAEHGLDVGAWCGPCHAAVMAEMQARQQLPTGGASCPPAAEEGVGGSNTIDHRAMRWQTPAPRRSGPPHPEEPNPGQENAIRRMEDPEP